MRSPSPLAPLLLPALALVGSVRAFAFPRPKFAGVGGALHASSPSGDGVDNSFFFATTVETDGGSSASASAVAAGGREQRRALGSQELLMVPRQYKPKIDKGESPFPCMPHTQATILSSTPSVDALRRAVDVAMDAHPLLRCRVAGSGEPDERIDLMQMVRKGEPDPCTFVAPPPGGDAYYDAGAVLTVVDVPAGGSGSSARKDLDESWRADFAGLVDDGSWCDASSGPLWRLTLHRLAGGGDGGDAPCALVFSANHAISDQSSINMLMDELISDVSSIERDGDAADRPSPQDIPIAMEDSVLGLNNRWSDVTTAGLSPDTIGYVLGKAAEGFKGPVTLPDGGGGDGGGALGAATTILGKSAGGESEASSERRSALQYRSLSKEATSALLDACRANGASVTHALVSAMALTSSDFIDGRQQSGAKEDKERNYKILQSLDMRRFGAKLDKCETVACMAGSNDLMLGPIPDRSGADVRSNPTLPSSRKLFWDLAREGGTQTKEFIESGGPENAVRVFDFAMTVSDMNNLVDLTARSADSLGRAYSAGLVNAGVYERQKAVRRDGGGDDERENIQIRHGKYEVQDVFFATSHARSGCLYQASAMTVNGELKITFHPAAPIVNDETSADFADAYVELIEKITGATTTTTLESDGSTSSNPIAGVSIPEGSLSLAAAGLGVAGVAIHFSAWAEFFANLSTMRDNVSNPQDFWDAFNFWVFFAVAHPILEPVLWISDVLHGSPGPKVADLVPVTFLLGNILFIGIAAWSKEFRNALNIAALSAFVTYVGAGLDGQAGLGDFNLQLNDNYRGAVVKGCPTYEDVRQPSMVGFDLNKYQGKWYEQKFHDWTQFKEVYDTTLDIKLTADGKGWIDDFGVRGPAPASAKLSWDKSPVANGAHYFLFGRVDKNDPPGILREKGFGVEFPNYIVDVKKDPATGEYTEAIQFQCLERGGVRVFEGINFMSRTPDMTEEDMQAMHQRAKAAGMNPYGAAEEQMHRVARRGVSEPEIDNSWQQMWKAIGVDKLLELLSESIEDGGR